jgi:antitoxin component YwqK of YwqJK toxin-antitoxin module
MKLLAIICTSISVFFIVAYLTMRENNHAKIIWEKYDNDNYKVVHQYFTDEGNDNDNYFYQEFYENGNLKIQGIENQRIRKGKWKAYFENGELEANFYFKNDTLNGPIELFDEYGNIKGKDIANRGYLMKNNKEIRNFIMQNFDISIQRPNWHDSIDIKVDTLISQIKKLVKEDRNKKSKKK